MSEYTMRLEDVPAYLGTSAEAVKALVADGRIPVQDREVDGVVGTWVAPRHLKNAGLVNLTDVATFAAGRRITVEQAESLVRLGHVHVSQMFEPLDPRLLVRRDTKAITAEMLAETVDEIEEYELEQRVHAAAAARVVEVAASQSAIDRLAHALGIEASLVERAIDERVAARRR